jgi:hypothetical protein
MSQTKDFINEHNDIVEMDLRQLSKERSFGRIFGVFNCRCLTFMCSDSSLKILNYRSVLKLHANAEISS